MKAELHSHSMYSHDSKTRIKDMFKHADKIGLDILAITDHDSIKSQKEAKRISKKYSVSYIEGVEISRNGHILAYGINEIPKGNVVDIIDYVKEHGGVYIAAHPFAEFLRPSFSIEELKKFRIWETVNGMSLNSRNKKAIEIATQLNKIQVSGSDAHFVEDIGKFACELHGRDFFSSIKHGKVKIINKKTNTFEIMKKRLIKKLI